MVQYGKHGYSKLSGMVMHVQYCVDAAGSETIIKTSAACGEAVSSPSLRNCVLQSTLPMSQRGKICKELRRCLALKQLGPVNFQG